MLLQAELISIVFQRMRKQHNVVQKFKWNKLRRIADWLTILMCVENLKTKWVEIWSRTKKIVAQNCLSLVCVVCTFVHRYDYSVHINNIEMGALQTQVHSSQCARTHNALHWQLAIVFMSIFALYTMKNDFLRNEVMNENYKVKKKLWLKRKLNMKNIYNWV